MVNTDPKKIKELLERGVEKVLVREILEKKLLSGKKLRLYYGIDPTGSEIHLGHGVVLWKLREFQKLGHEVILLIGDFTARIGDPSGRDLARKPLSEKQVKENMKNYKKQAGKILDFNKVKIKYNSQWLSKLKFEDILELASHFTVQKMLQRDMFQRRLKAEQPISLQEFLYPLMQGYDSVAMNVDLEIAGVDQTFNMLMGRTLQKICNNKDKDILTTKLLIGLDGRKMSKTYENTIPIGIEPNDMYGKVMSMKDELIPDYFELATKIPMEEVKKIQDGLASGKCNPRDLKARLAKEITTMYHGEKVAGKAEQEFNRVFRDKELPTDAPAYEPKQEKMNILDLLYNSGLTKSKAEAKRLVIEGGVKIDSEKQIDWQKQIEIKNEMTVQAGKRKFIKIKSRYGKNTHR